MYNITISARPLCITIFVGFSFFLSFGVTLVEIQCITKAGATDQLGLGNRDFQMFFRIDFFSCFGWVKNEKYNNVIKNTTTIS